MRHRLLFIVMAMFAGTILLAGAGWLRAQDGPEQPQIVGGEEAEPGAWPWQAALVFADVVNIYDGQFCGGSLIDAHWVVTAAHCVSNHTPDQIDVVLGAHDLFRPEPGYQRLSAVRFIIHPDYDPYYYDSDIALILLDEPAELGSGVGLPVQPIAPVPPDVGPLTGEIGTVIGWGSTLPYSWTGDLAYPERLQQVELPILSNAACNDAFAEQFVEGVTDNMLCAGLLRKGGRAACFGDSGGPLMVQDPSSAAWQVAGIVSWGYGCAQPGLPGVYTRVSRFTEWMDETISASYLALDKVASATAVAPGDLLSYTLTLRNVGSIVASDLTLTDPLPNGTTALPDTITGGGVLGGDGTITWENITLDASEAFSVGFTVRVADDFLEDATLFADDIETPSSAWRVAHDTGLVDLDWQVSGERPYRGANAWHAPNSSAISDLYLVLELPDALPAGVELSFWHWYDIEYFYDGGVIEISTNGGADWEDLGELIVENGYVDTLTTWEAQPLAGRPAFTGYSDGWLQTRVDLTPFAGESPQVRFRYASDESIGYEGWYVDDVRVGRSETLRNVAFVDGLPGSVVTTAVRFLPTEFSYVPILVIP